MVPLGLCTEVFINMSSISVRVHTIWHDVRLERRGQEHRRCSGPPPPHSAEPTGLGERPSDKGPRAGSQTPPSKQVPSYPRTGLQLSSVQHPWSWCAPCASLQCSLYLLSPPVPVDGQDSAAVLGLPGSEGGRHMNSDYHPEEHPSLRRVMHRGPGEPEHGRWLTRPQGGDGSYRQVGSAGCVWAQAHVGVPLTPPCSQ